MHVCLMTVLVMLYSWVCITCGLRIDCTVWVGCKMGEFFSVDWLGVLFVLVGSLVKTVLACMGSCTGRWCCVMFYVSWQLMSVWHQLPCMP
jgi:hypothetical protein